MYNQTNEFVYLGGNVNHNTDLSIEVHRKYTLKLYDRPSALLKLKIRMLKAEVLETMLYDYVTWSPCAYHYEPLRRAHHRFVARCIGWPKHKRAATRFPIWTSLSRREVGASRRHYAGGGSCLRGLWRAWRIRDITGNIPASPFLFISGKRLHI